MPILHPNALIQCNRTSNPIASIGALQILRQFNSMDRENAEVEDLSENFQQLYPFLKSELLENTAFEHDSFSRQWLSKMLDYNVHRAKPNTGISVVETYKLLKANNNGSVTVCDQFPEQEEEEFLASVLGWCVKWLIGCVIVLDDVVANSNPNGDHPSWFRLPSVGMTAVNDGGLLGTQIYMILKRYFRNMPYYVDLIDLFNEVEYQISHGEMLDLINAEKDVSIFTSQLQTKICKCKTGYGKFYLPFACAILVLGEKLQEYGDVKSLPLEMGVYFQVQGDYSDCYGDSDKKLKWSWLVIKAMEVCNEEQGKVLNDHYGKADEDSVAAVKTVYEEINLQGVYDQYVMEMYKRLMTRIEGVPDQAVQTVLKAYLGKIHKKRE